MIVVLFNKDVEVSVLSIKQAHNLGGGVGFWCFLLLNSATRIKEKPGRGTEFFKGVLVPWG